MIYNQMVTWTAFAILAMFSFENVVSEQEDYLTDYSAELRRKFGEKEDGKQEEVWQVLNTPHFLWHL